jgi:hypothetical protein
MKNKYNQGNTFILLVIFIALVAGIYAFTKTNGFSSFYSNKMATPKPMVKNADDLQKISKELDDTNIDKTFEADLKQLDSDAKF